jgi:hypothetical protein
MSALKPFIGSAFLNPLDFPEKPSLASRLPNVKFWDIRPNVQQRGAIENINILNVQDVTVDAPEAHNR